MYLTQHPILAIAVVVVLLLLAAQFLGRLMLSYSLGEEALIFRLFHLFEVMKVPYGEIEEPQIKSRSRAPTSMRRIHMNNRLIARGIVMGKRKGVYNSVTLTPANPESFLAALNEKRRLAPRE